MKRLKNYLVLATLLIYGYSKACSPLTTQPPGSPGYSMQIVGTNMLLNLNSTSTWNNCNYSIQVEIVCNGNAFPGFAPYYYTSPPFTQSGNPTVIPQMTISLAGLCAGGVYQIRWRQFSGGAWTAPTSFTMPGVPIPTSMSVTATPPNICWPQTSQLTASVTGGCGGGAIGYTWSPGSSLSCINCTNPIASPSVNTTYTVIAGGSGPSSCWTASASITVTAFTVMPTVGTPSAVPSLCEGQFNTVSISSATGLLQWQSSFNGGPFTDVPGANGTTMVTSTLVPGNYCYRLNASGCGGSVTSQPICSNVYPYPVITVTSVPICAGKNATLVATGANSYSWPFALQPVGPNSATVQLLANTSYTITGASNGCSNTAVANVTVNPYPGASPSCNSPACNGNPINFSTAAIGTYQWAGPNGWTDATQNPVIPVTSPSMAGVYNLTVTSNNCSSTGSVNVTVLSPTASISNTGPYCANSNVQLNSSPSSGIQTFMWTGPNGFISGSQNPFINNAPAAASGIYSLVVSDGTCSSASQTMAVTVYPLPTPDPVSNSPVCELTALNLSVTPMPGTIYHWTGPNNYSVTSSNPVIFPVASFASGVYMVTAVDGFGCTGSATVNVGILPIPDIVVSGDMACTGFPASLKASGGIAYSWTGPNDFTSNLQNPGFTSVSQSEVGEYTVVITASNACTVAAVAQLTVFPAPQPTAACLTPVVCLGGKANFEASEGYVYNWYGPNNFVSHEQNPLIEAITTLDYAGSYTLTVIDEHGCQGSTIADLTVKPLPTATISASVNNKCVPFCSDFSIASGSDLQTIQWNLDGQGVNTGNSFSKCFQTDGSKILRTIFSDGFGCVNTSSYQVDVYPIPYADFHFGPGDPVENSQVQFTDASKGPEINKWTWYFEKNGTLPATYQNPDYIFEKPGSWPVTMIISNKWGCQDTITKIVVVGEDFAIYIPNAFSPNGDGLNDTFQPKGLGITEYKMQIFDRWGERIFVSTDIMQGWDGTYKGKPCKEEVYVWQIFVTNKNAKTKEYKGHVSIMK